MKGLESKKIKLESGTEIEVRGLKVKQVLELNQTLPSGILQNIDGSGNVDLSAASGMLQSVMDYVTDKKCIDPVIQSNEEAYYIEKDGKKEELSFEETSEVVQAIFELSYGNSEPQKKAEGDKVKKGTKVNG